MMYSFKKHFVSTLLVLVVSSNLLFAQSIPLMNPDTIKAGMYDNGKMWTFDVPPTDFFKKTYNFEADKQWFEYVQKAALRFATYCSCSFVSSNGLVMTNHHCARESGVTAQNANENLMENGFYAKTLADERKVPGLFVDQLQQIEDITERVQKIMSTGTTDADKVRMRDGELAKIRSEYQQKDGWKGLQLETKIFYNGGRYALYGFKRHNDVRLVFMPELQLGYFGGDPDNFTYPRYNLDCSFFRVYDETGKPLKTDYFFKFNPNGVKENEPVFVVGNPGTTRRGFTSSDHEYLRELVPMQLKQLKSTSLALQEYNKTLKSDSLMNEIFGIENSYKAISGQLEALRDNYLMARKKAFENDFKTAVRSKPELRQDYAIWDELTLLNQTRKKYIKDLNLMNITNVNDGLGIASQIALATVSKGGSGQVAAGKGNDALVNVPAPASMQLEELMLTAHLELAAAFLSPTDPYLQEALHGKSPKEAAAELIKTTRVYDKAGRQELLEKGGPDPLVNLARLALPRLNEANAKFGEVNPKITSIRAKMGKMMYDVYGTNVPPDATFSLRINDGIVKGFDYNGTTAPYKTHFAGMYERYYSFDGKYPWSLPERWKNPPADLLKAPFNFVTTNDIIGGNSGSPMINKNREAIGLVFDGNMESLAGAYIYEPTKNRAVGVHTGGMIAAMRYIYKADRLVKELEGK